MKNITFVGLIAFSLNAFLGASNSWSAEKPEALQEIGITEHRGAAVHIKTLEFTDDHGKDVILGDFFKKKRPVILALVYYKCPHLCNLLLNGLVSSLKGLDWMVGNQFDVVAVSIDPHETAALAKEKKESYLKVYDRPASADGWHFLVGAEDQIKTLADDIGFRFKYDEEGQQYAHAASIFILTPEGKISRYIYGVTFNNKQLRLSLLEAADGKIGSVVEQILLFCFHFDPTKNSYTLSIWRVVQAVLILQVFVLFFALLLLWKKDRDFKK